VCSQKGKEKYKNLAITSLVRPNLEYGFAYWDPCTKGQINALDRIQKKAAYFTNHTQECE